MIVTDETSCRSGDYPKLWTGLLLGVTNTASLGISLQVTHVEPGGAQELHRHPEDQAYYVVAGSGAVTVDQEERAVQVGQAVFIPGNALHGIRNLGEERLTYLTANQAFGPEQENRTWPNAPGSGPV